MRRLFRPALTTPYACPRPFRSPLLPLRGAIAGETPRIDCYHAEPLDGGRAMVVTHYAKWLMPQHGIDEVESEEYEPQSLEAAARFIQLQVRAAGLSPIAEADMPLQDSWDAASRALTGDTVALPPEFSFLGGVPLMIDALAQHGLMAQKHGGLQRIENGRPVGNGTAESAVVRRVQEVQARNFIEPTTLKADLPLPPRAKEGDCLFKPDRNDILRPKTVDCRVNEGTLRLELDAGAGFQGIYLIDKSGWFSKQAELVPLAVFGPAWPYTGFKKRQISEVELELFFGNFSEMTKPNQDHTMKSQGDTGFAHLLYAKRAFDKLRADTAKVAAQAAPALASPARPSASGQAIKLPGGKIGELEL